MIKIAICDDEIDFLKFMGMQSKNIVHLVTVILCPFFSPERLCFMRRKNRNFNYRDRCIGLQMKMKFAVQEIPYMRMPLFKQYTIHDDYAIMALIEAGLRVSILVELILHRTNYQIKLCATEPRVSRTIAIGYKDKSNLLIACKRFIELLKSHLNELP